MKTSAGLIWLISLEVEFLPWWQEIILNWVSTWSTIGTMVVVSADGESTAEWDLPPDWELDRIALEEQWGAQCRDS